jgi:hypothetical protein
MRNDLFSFSEKKFVFNYQSEFLDGCPTHPPMFYSDEEILQLLEIKPSGIR